MQLSECVLISSKQTASLLGVAQQTLAVWRCKQNFHLPWVKIGRKVMYDQNEVLAFIKANKQLSQQRVQSTVAKNSEPVDEYF